MDMPTMTDDNTSSFFIDTDRELLADNHEKSQMAWYDLILQVVAVCDVVAIMDSRGNFYRLPKQLATTTSALLYALASKIDHRSCVAALARLEAHKQAAVPTLLQSCLLW